MLPDFNWKKMNDKNTDNLLANVDIEMGKKTHTQLQMVDSKKASKQEEKW